MNWILLLESTGVKMIWRILTITFCGALAVSATPQSKKSNRNTTLTGCVDEQPGPQYVLRGLDELKLIAKLEPDGFSVQSFAKYLGKKVSVNGRLSSDGEPVVIRVRAIKALSGACTPPETRGSESAAIVKADIKTLTGCVDEQPGPKYMLIGPEKREIRAELEPIGFTVQNFARFLGHSVSIHGELFLQRNPPLMRIKQLDDIRDLSARCTPQWDRSVIQAPTLGAGDRVPADARLLVAVNLTIDEAPDSAMLPVGDRIAHSLAIRVELRNVLIALILTCAAI